METEAETPEPISLEKIEANESLCNQFDAVVHKDAIQELQKVENGHNLHSGSVGNFNAEDSVLAQNATNAISNPETEGKVGFSDGKSFWESPSLAKVNSEEICESYKDCEEKDISVLKMPAALDDEIQIQKDQPNECLEAPIGVTETSLENAKTKSNELAETSELEKLQVQPVTSFVELNLQEENTEGNDGKFTEDEKPKAPMENQPQRDHQLVETFEVSSDETMMEATSARQNSQEKKSEFSPQKEEIEGKKPNEDQDLKSGDETLQTVMETLCQDQEDAPLASDSMNLLKDAGVAGETRDMEESMEKRMEKEACNKSEGRSNNMDILSIPIKQDTNDTSFLEEELEDEKQERSTNLKEMRTCPEPMNEKEEIQNEKNVSVEDSLNVSMATRSMTSPTIQNNEKKILDADDKTSQTLDISCTAMVMEETSSLKAGAEEKCPPESTSSHLLEEISLKIDSIKKMNDDDKVDLDGEIQENYTERVKYTDEEVSTQISGKVSKMEQLKRPAEVVCEDPETTAAERETLEKKEGQSNVERSILEEIEGGETSISYDHRKNEAIMNKNPEPDELSDKTGTMVAEEQEKISNSEPAGASPEKENIGEVIDRKNTEAIIIEHEKTTDAATASGYMQTSDMGKLESKEKSENINAKEIRDVCTMEEFSESYLYKGEDRIIQEDVDVNDQNITLPGFQTYDSSCQEGEKEKDRVEEQTPEVKQEDRTFKARFADVNGISKEEGNEELKIINEETRANKMGEVREENDKCTEPQNTQKDAAIEAHHAPEEHKPKKLKGEVSEVIEMADAETDIEEHITEEATNRDVSVTSIAEMVKDCYQNDEGHERLKTAGEGEVSEMQIKEDVSVRDLSMKSIGEKTVDTISQEYEVSKGNEISDANKATVEQRMEVAVHPVSASKEMAVENDASEEEQGLMRNFNERSKEEREGTETKLIDDTGENETPKEEVAAHPALLEQNLKPVDSIDKIEITEVMSQNKDVNDVSLAKDVTTDGPEENFHEQSKALLEEACHSVKACEVSKNTELAVTEQEEISVSERISEFIQTSETESVEVGKSSNSKEEVENIADKEEHIVESIINKEQHSNETECKDIENKNLGEDGLINDHKTASLRDDMVDQRCHEDEKEVKNIDEWTHALESENQILDAEDVIGIQNEEVHIRTEKMDAGDDTKIKKEIGAVRNIKKTTEESPEKDKKEGENPKEEVTEDLDVIRMSKDSEEIIHEHDVIMDQLKVNVREEVRQIFAVDEKERKKLGKEVYANPEKPNSSEDLEKKIPEDVVSVISHHSMSTKQEIFTESVEKEKDEEMQIFKGEVLGEAVHVTACKYTKEKTMEDSIATEAYTASTEEVVQESSHEEKVHENLETSEAEAVHKQIMQDVTVPHLYTTSLGEETIKKSSEENELSKLSIEQLCEEINTASAREDTGNQITKDRTGINAFMDRTGINTFMVPSYEQTAEESGWGDEQETQNQQEVQYSDSKSPKGATDSIKEIDLGLDEEFKKEISNVSNLIEEPSEEIAQKKNIESPSHATLVCAMCNNEEHGITQNHVLMGHSKTLVMEEAEKSHCWKDEKEATKSEKDFYKVYPELETTIGSKDIKNITNENKNQILTERSSQDETEAEKLKEELVGSVDTASSSKDIENVVKESSNEEEVPELLETTNTDGVVEKQIREDMTASLGEETKTEGSQENKLYEEVITAETKEDVENQTVKDEIDTERDKRVPRNEKTLNESIERLSHASSAPALSEEQIKEIPKEKETANNNHETASITMTTEDKGLYGTELEGEVLVNASQLASRDMSPSPAEASLRNSQDLHVQDMELEKISNSVENVTGPGETLFSEKSGADEAKQELPSNGSMTLQTDQDTGITAVVEIVASNSFSDGKLEKKLECEILSTEKSGTDKAKQEMGDMPRNGSVALPADQDIGTTAIMEMSARTSLSNEKLEAKLKEEVLLTEKSDADDAEQELPNNGSMTLPTDQDTGTTAAVEIGASNSFSDEKSEEKLQCENLAMEKSGADEAKQEKDEMKSNGSTALPADHDTETTTAVEMVSSTSSLDGKLEGKSEGEVLLTEKLGEEAKQEMPRDGIEALPTVVTETVASNSFSDDNLEGKLGEVLLAKDLGHEAKQELPSDGSMTQPTDQDTTSEKKSECEILSTEKSGVNEVKQEMDEMSSDGSALPADQDTGTIAVMEIADSNSYSDEKLEGKSEGEVLLLEKSDANEAKEELPSDSSTILPTDQDTGTTAAVEIAASNSFSDERSEEKSQCEIFSTEKSGADEAEQEMHEIKCDGSEALLADQDTETNTVVEIAASNSFSDEKSQEPLMPISDDHEFELLKEIKIENDTPVEDLLCENLKSPVEAQIEEAMDMQMEEATNLGEGSEDIGKESLIPELDSKKLSSEPKDVILNGHNLIEVIAFCEKNKSETPAPGLEKAMSEGEDQYDVLSNEAEATGAYANLEKDVLKKEDPIKDIDQAFDASRNEGMIAEDMLVVIKAKDHNHETESFDVTDYENRTQTLEVIDPSGKLEHASGSLIDHDLSPKTLPETEKTELEERESVKDQDAIFVKNQVHDQCLAEQEKEGRDLEKERQKFISNDKSDGAKANEPMKNIMIIEKISDGTWKNDESETAGGEMTKQETIAKYVKLFGAKDSGLSTEENVEAIYCNEDTGIENWSYFEHLIKKVNAYPEEEVSREQILKKEGHKILNKDSIAASQVSEENIEAETIGNAEDLVEKLHGEPVIVETNETRILENESRGEEITETLVVGFEENIQETYETIDKNTKNDNIINTNFEIASNFVFDHTTIENEDEDQESQTVEKPGADDGVAQTGKHDIEKDAPVENVESFKKDEEAIETISLQDLAENKNLKEDTETLNLGEKIETAELDSSQKKIDDLPNLNIKHASAEETLVGEVGGCEEFPNFESHKLEMGLDSMSEAQVQEPLNVANEIEYHKRIVNGENSDNLSVNDGSSGKTFQENRDGDEHVMEAEHNLKLTARDKQVEETTEVSISHENASASKNIRKSGNDKNDGEYETKGEGNTEESSNLVSEKLIHKLDAEEFQGQKIYYEKEDARKDLLNQKGSCSCERVLVEPDKETADLTAQLDEMAMKDGEEKSRIVDAPPARNAPSDEAPEDSDKNLENRMPEELVHETIDENAEAKGNVTKDTSTSEGLLEVRQASESAPPIGKIEELHREELSYDSGGVTSVKEAAQKEVHGEEEKTDEGVEIQERELVKQSTNDMSLPVEERVEAIQDEAPVEEIIDEGVNQIDDLSMEDSVCTYEEVETHKLNERNLQETTMLEQTSELTNEKHIHTEAVTIENPETETPITSRALKSTPANLIGDSLTKEENQKDGQALVMESELKEVESVGVGKVQDLKEDTITELKSSDSDNVSLADVAQQSTKDSRKMVEYQIDEKKTSTNKEEQEMKEAPTTELEEEKAGEAKNDQNEEHEEEHKKADPISDSPIMVEASRDVDVKSNPKKSHNILSGVGSKVKHSISKVKKAITGKSSHHKQLSPNK